MNRLEKREKVLGRKQGILSICEDLHMARHGDLHIDPEDKRLFVAFLQACLKTWEDGHRQDKPYDDAVKMLVQRTLEETIS